MTAIPKGRVAWPRQAEPVTVNSGDASAAWFERARRVLAGGVSSSARATSAGRIPHPVYVSRGQGATIWDVDGNRYTDFLLGYGSSILGHAHPSIVRAVQEQAERGSMFGACNTLEVELAEQICSMAPCAELVRFGNSGSEAMCGAVRAARGFTGRSKVLKFEGHYHGWVDVLAVSNRPSVPEAGPMESPRSCPHSLGIPPGVYADVVVCPWNEPGILRSLLNAHEGEIGALVAEPIVANNACTMPAAGFLEMLREECTRRGIVLIFDEIVTGFRLARGGAQEIFGVVPDMAVYSKALGGGLPISAFCGRRDIMTPVALNTVKHGGTYNGNPVCAAGALATLRELDAPGTIERITLAGATIAEAARRAAADFGVPCAVQGMGGMFQIVFTPDGAPVRQYRDLACADTARFAAFWQALFDRRVSINASGAACIFTSAAHTSDDIEKAGAAVREAMREVA